MITHQAALTIFGKWLRSQVKFPEDIMGVKNTLLELLHGTYGNPKNPRTLASLAAKFDGLCDYEFSRALGITSALTFFSPNPPPNSSLDQEFALDMIRRAIRQKTGTTVDNYPVMLKLLVSNTDTEELKAKITRDLGLETKDTCLVRELKEINKRMSELVRC